MSKESVVRPMFSIITVCWNDKAGLIATRQSLEKQTCRDFEWIIVDGNSTDGTKEFLDALPAECIWASEPDDGLYDAMNKGINIANGDYLFFLNSGDVFADEEVLTVIKNRVNKKERPDFIYGDALENSSGGENLLKKARSHQWLWYGMFTHHQAMFYKRSSIGALKYRLEYKLAADYGFTSEFLMQVDNVHYIPSPICVFEGGGLTSSWEAHKLGMKEQWSVGRQLQKKSILFSIGTLFLHLMKHASLRVFPGIVRFLRYKK